MDGQARVTRGSADNDEIRGARLCVSRQLEARLRFLDVLALLLLDVRLDEEQQTGNEAQTSARDSETERVTQIIVRMAWHPTVGIAQTGKYYDCYCSADSSSEK